MSYPKAKRRNLEQRWSFHSIINSLSRAESEVKWLGVFKHLFFQYGMGSHILHQDADGVAVVLERNNRSDERRNAVELAHGAQMISDLSVMAFVREKIFACRLDSVANWLERRHEDLYSDEL